LLLGPIARFERHRLKRLEFAKIGTWMDFRDAVFETIHGLMKSDRNVMIVTNDMGAMLLDRIRSEFPERVVNLGIAEQNLISVCGGLAQAGKQVFAFGIASHVATRGFEQIKLDLCTMNLPVCVIGVGPGLAYGNDGPTHHGTEDVAFMRALPNMTIYNPCDAVATIGCVRLAYEGRSPTYLRLDKENLDPLYRPDDDLSAGLKILRDGHDCTIFVTGILALRAMSAAERLSEGGIEARIVDVFRLKPINDSAILDILQTSRKIVTVEEHCRIGGLASIVAELMAVNRISLPLDIVSLPDAYLLGSASRSWAHEAFGLTADALTTRLRKSPVDAKA